MKKIVYYFIVHGTVAYVCIHLVGITVQKPLQQLMN